MARRRTRVLSILWLILFSSQALAQPSNRDCMAYALMRESGGEGIITTRAVYDVILNRQKRSGKSVCQVLREPGQFPWAKNGFKKVNIYHLTKLEMVAIMHPVVPENVLYFNHTRENSGVFYKRYGKLWFNKEK